MAKVNTESDWFASITQVGARWHVKLYFEIAAGRRKLWRQRWCQTEAEARQVRCALLEESTGVRCDDASLVGDDTGVQAASKRGDAPRR